MKLEFHKYSGTGNDFIIIDDRSNKFDKYNSAFISSLCNRRSGIGSDGLILLQKHSEFDFNMIYFNADGREGSMCGNGGRCMIDFAHYLGLIDDDCIFNACDGIHQGVWSPDSISLKMSNVDCIEIIDHHYFLDTGSPHYVQFVDNLDNYDVLNQGREIRYSDRFKSKGVNVNFVEVNNDNLFVRTYERGVETETYSCGTGVTAAAIVFHKSKKDVKMLKIKTLGGFLEVVFDVKDDVYTDIWLKGSVQKIYTGVISC